MVMLPCKHCTSRFCGYYCRFYVGKRNTWINFGGSK